MLRTRWAGRSLLLHSHNLSVIRSRTDVCCAVLCCAVVWRRGVGDWQCLLHMPVEAQLGAVRKFPGGVATIARGVRAVLALQSLACKRKDDDEKGNASEYLGVRRALPTDAVRAGGVPSERTHVVKVPPPALTTATQ